MYDAELGVFLSRDFLRYLNKYRAWSNNPVGQVDRDGLADADVVAADEAFEKAAAASYAIQRVLAGLKARYENERDDARANQIAREYNKKVGEFKQIENTVKDALSRLTVLAQTSFKQVKRDQNSFGGKGFLVEWLVTGLSANLTYRQVVTGKVTLKCTDATGKQSVVLTGSINESANTSITLAPGLLHASEEIGLSLLVGAIIGFIFCQIVRFVRDQRDILILVFCAILVAIGLSLRWHLSLILTNMAIGFTLVKVSGSKKSTCIKRKSVS